VALTPAQSQTLQANIEADPVLNAIANTPDGNFEIAALYNLLASPDFWVWRTSVTEAEYVSQSGPDGTNWSWTQYIARTEPERDGWKRLMGPGFANPSLPNVRQGLADIFSGAQAAPIAQRAHLTAMSRRKATRAEKLFATGTGSTASPATMVVEGTLDYHDVEQARNLP
jgi:hypothetical protein